MYVKSFCISQSGAHLPPPLVLWSGATAIPVEYIHTHTPPRIISEVNYEPRVKEALPGVMRGKRTSPQADFLNSISKLNFFLFLQAAKYKLAALPVAGALIGGVVGGPIGLLAGFKVAGIAAALGGGVLGFTGGKLIQRRKQKMMEKLTSSCPDLPSQSVKKCS